MSKIALHNAKDSWLLLIDVASYLYVKECDSQETMIIENLYPKYFDRSRRKSGHRLAHAPLHFCICDILCGLL